MNLAAYLEIGIAGVVGLLAIVGAFVTGVKAIGLAIPGNDPVERFGKLLEEKLKPVTDKIEEGVDLLNPKTNGGAGKGREE